MKFVCFSFINPIALRKAKIVYNFGLSECNRIEIFIVEIAFVYIMLTAHGHAYLKFYIVQATPP